MAMVQLAGFGGYDSVTVRRLASLAHVSTGTFYSLFSGIDHCFLEVHKALVERASERIAESRTSRLGQHEQAARSIRALVGALTEDPAFARIITTEIFSGGPAALGPARNGEALLGNALKQSLDRREHQVSPALATWITAGILHWVRTRPETFSSLPDERSLEEMGKWAQRVIASSQDSEGRPWQPPVGRDAPIGRRPQEASGGKDDQLLIAAASRLMISEGYPGLTASRICGAAGITMAAFRRHFPDVDALCLEVSRRLASRLFGLDREDQSAGSSPASRGVAEVCTRIVSDPTAARAAILGISEPGYRGLACRARLITDIAARWCSDAQTSTEHDALTSEVTVAGLWGTLESELLGDRASRLPETAGALSRLFAVATTVSPASSKRVKKHRTKVLDG